MTDATYISRPGLIAAERGTKGYEGTGIFESASGMVDDLAHRDFLGFGGNFAATGLALLGTVMDPLQAVFAAGVGWLMEHVSILREPLDKLLGDPKAIEAHAQTWKNIEGRIYEATDFFVDEVNKSTALWAAQSAEAYRRRARGHAESIQAMGKIADALGKITTIAGAIVGIVRNTIRDIVAQVVGACISKAIQALTVVLIPKVAAEVAALVADTSRKILNLLRRLLSGIGQLRGFTKLCDGILERVGQANRDVLRLEAFRLEAAGTSGPGLSGVKQAHQTVSAGHVAAHGPLNQFLVQTARSAGAENTAQNAGSAGDKLTEEDPAPRHIDMPL